jgi:hypothetical protein
MKGGEAEDEEEEAEHGKKIYDFSFLIAWWNLLRRFPKWIRHRQSCTTR